MAMFFGQAQYSFGNGNGGVPPGQFVPPDIAAGAWLLVAGAILVLLVVAIAFAAVSAVMEFVFVESLRAETVTVRRY